MDAIVPEVPGVTSVYLRGRQLDRLPVRAGQFFLWRFLDGPGWSRANPYSLSAPPASGTLRITVKDLGDGSSRAASLRPGTRVLVEGPYGRFTGEDYRGGPELPRSYQGGIERIVPGIARHRVYICGPDAWSAAVREAALEAGVPADRVHHESFAW